MHHTLEAAQQRATPTSPSPDPGYIPTTLVLLMKSLIYLDIKQRVGEALLISLSKWANRQMGTL